jgi:hypothetical protein
MRQGYLPEPHHELLLRASLWKGEESLRFFHQWKSELPFHDIDYASQRLLPLLYKNLSAQNVADPLLDRLKGIYRYTWAENQKLLSQVPILVQGFNERNIPCLLLKGAGLTATCYEGNFGMRTMTDLDILIPEDKVDVAVAWLNQSGWKSTSIYRREYVAAHHASNFKHANGINLDLHWHLLHQRADFFYDRLFWEKAVTSELRGTRFLTLCATDHLIHACLHGSHWDEVKTLRWVADAYTLIEKSSIDWNRVVSLSSSLEIRLLILDMLDYLKTNYRAPIPQSVLDELSRVESDAWERREYELIKRPRGFFGELPMHWLRSTKHLDRRGIFKKIQAFVEHLKSHYAADDYAGVGKVLARRAWNKLRKRRFPEAPQ